MSVIKVSQRNKDDEKTPTRVYSKKQENTIADKFSGNRQKNSGATPFEKGDVKLDDILIECKTKTTKSDSISIKREWLEKIDKESLFMGKQYGVLAFNFGPGEENHYIIDECLFKKLTEMIAE